MSNSHHPANVAIDSKFILMLAERQGNFEVSRLHHQEQLTETLNNYNPPLTTLQILKNNLRNKLNMRFSLVAALALAGSAIASPTPSNGVDDSLQKQIQNLEVQILNVINDIVQSNPNIKNDYNNGAKQFGTIASGLSGPQPCSIFTPGTPTTANGAIQALQTSTSKLQSLSLDLLDPNKKLANGDFRANVCQGLQYYSAVSKFVGV
ncbi:MAG: hypothetical protein M1820_000602 [Bogoriella megaspora]|nr:MAG: hypothetical protein M1820_000602 [Bogoriella megaspora]